MKAAVLLGIALCAITVAPAFAAPKFSFGDDTGSYANDGECDDPRFSGPGMTGTALLSDDVLQVPEQEGVGAEAEQQCGHDHERGPHDPLAWRQRCAHACHRRWAPRHAGRGRWTPAQSRSLRSP